MTKMHIHANQQRERHQLNKMKIHKLINKSNKNREILNSSIRQPIPLLGLQVHLVLAQGNLQSQAFLQQGRAQL